MPWLFETQFPHLEVEDLRVGPVRCCPQCLTLAPSSWSQEWSLLCKATSSNPLILQKWDQSPEQKGRAIWGDRRGKRISS